MSTSSVLANFWSSRLEEREGDDRRRDCAARGRTVLAVAEMGREEARAARESGVCRSFLELPGGLVRIRAGWRRGRSVARAGALAAALDPWDRRPPRGADGQPRASA